MADALAAASSIGGALIGGAMSLGGTALQYKYNKKLMEQQNQYNIDMWNRQNEYNSPQAQMQRYKDAGLNPNLIYGSGTASAGNASSPPQMYAPEAPNVDKAAQELSKLFNVANLVSTYQSLRKNDLQNMVLQNEATITANEAEKRALEVSAMQEMAENYVFDSRTGTYVYAPPDPDHIHHYFRPGQQSNWYLNKLLESNIYRWKNATVIPYRRALLQAQTDFLAPQIKMKNYDWNNYEETFWLDRASGHNYGGMIKAIGHYLGWW